MIIKGCSESAVPLGKGKKDFFPKTRSCAETSQREAERSQPRLCQRSSNAASLQTLQEDHGAQKSPDETSSLLPTAASSSTEFWGGLGTVHPSIHRVTGDRNSQVCHRSITPHSHSEHACVAANSLPAPTEQASEASVLLRIKSSPFPLEGAWL